jgi:hypothetical protein
MQEDLIMGAILGDRDVTSRRQANAGVSKRWVVGVGLLMAVIGPPTRATAAEFLEPEEGVFAGYVGPEPYQLVLRRALLAGDNYRLCQLVTVPSFSQESAVYMVRGQDGRVNVVSRVLRDQLWTSMLGEMQKTAKNNAISLDAVAQSIALEKLRTAVDTHRVSLDTKTAEMALGLCRDVLLRTRYPDSPTAGLDGTTYYAGHWIQGAFLGAHTWSPEKGTLAADFVAMERALQGYADSTENGRAQAKVDLIAKAQLLAAHLKVLKSAEQANKALD